MAAAPSRQSPAAQPGVPWTTATRGRSLFCSTVRKPVRSRYRSRYQSVGLYGWISCHRNTTRSQVAPTACAAWSWRLASTTPSIGCGLYQRSAAAGDASTSSRPPTSNTGHRRRRRRRRWALSQPTCRLATNVDGTRASRVAPSRAAASPTAPGPGLPEGRLGLRCRRTGGRCCRGCRARGAGRGSGRGGRRSGGRAPG
jgi:hypothetical protein